MILHHVPDGTHFFVEAAAVLHTKILGHGDLHAVDVGAVLGRLEKRVGKAKIQQILHRLLAEVMINAENRRLGELK
jgi:hypothetical protein